jgi:hypothetical protein
MGNPALSRSDGLKAGEERAAGVWGCVTPRVLFIWSGRVSGKRKRQGKVFPARKPKFGSHESMNHHNPDKRKRPLKTKTTPVSPETKNMEEPDTPERKRGVVRSLAPDRLQIP